MWRHSVGYKTCDDGSGVQYRTTEGSYTVGSEQAAGTVTGLLGNIVDDTMHFVDDLLARVNGAEIDTRNAVTGLVDASGSPSSEPDMAALQAQLEALQSKMQQLSGHQAN
jgi:hypothetical protein